MAITCLFYIGESYMCRVILKLPVYTVYVNNVLVHAATLYSVLRSLCFLQNYNLEISDTKMEAKININQNYARDRKKQREINRFPAFELNTSLV